MNWREQMWPDGEPALVVELAGLADMVLVGADEADRVFGTDDPAALRRLLPDPATLVVKDGDRRALAVDRDGGVVAETRRCRCRWWSRSGPATRSPPGCSTGVVARRAGRPLPAPRALCAAGAVLTVHADSAAAAERRARGCACWTPPDRGVGEDPGSGRTGFSGPVAVGGSATAMSQSVRRALQILVQLGSGPATWTSWRRRRTCTRRPCCGCCARWPRSTSCSATAATATTSAHASTSCPRAGWSSARCVASPRRTWSRSTARTAAPRTCPSMDGSEVVYIDKLESHDHDPDGLADRAARPVHSTAAGQGAARRPAATPSWTRSSRPTGLHRASRPTRSPTAAALPGRAGHGPRAGLGARPRGERAIDQLHRRPGPRRIRPGGGRGVGVGARHRTAATTGCSTCCRRTAGGRRAHLAGLRLVGRSSDHNPDTQDFGMTNAR